MKAESDNDRILLDRTRRRWIGTHGGRAPPLDLPPTLQEMALEWFQLSDADGSGTLEKSELAEALESVRLESTADVLKEMISLMDFGGRTIDYTEFNSFLGTKVCLQCCGGCMLNLSLLSLLASHRRCWTDRGEIDGWLALRECLYYLQDVFCLLA